MYFRDRDTGNTVTDGTYPKKIAAERVRARIDRFLVQEWVEELVDPDDPDTRTYAPESIHSFYATLSTIMNPQAATGCLRGCQSVQGPLVGVGHGVLGQVS